MNSGIETSDGNLSSLLYADDIILLAPSEESLQVMLDEMVNWTNKWAIGVNPVKSKIAHWILSNTFVLLTLLFTLKSISRYMFVIAKI